MPSAKLSKAVVEAVRVQPGGVPLFLWDTMLPGFGLRTTSTVRAFVVQKRDDVTAKTVRTTIGRFPQLSVDAARTKAIALLTVQPKPHSQHTVQTLMHSFINNYAVKKHKPKTLHEERQLIARYIIPDLGPLSLCELTKARVTSWHSDSGIPTISANRALAHLSKACSYAIARDWLQHNPCIGVERNKERVRERFLSDVELMNLFLQLHKRSATYHWFVALALTGLRVSELLSDFHFDSDRKVIWFSDSKTGAKSIPLNEQANRLLQQVEFVGHSRPNYWTLRNDFKVACNEAGIRGVSIHTLRHTIATYMAQHGNSSFQIAAMGGWRSLSMVQRYVSLHGVGMPHPTPAGERIVKAIGLQ